MGLDIYYMKNIKRISDYPEDDDYDYDHHYLQPNEQFNVHGEIRDGIYSAEDEQSFRVGSYSGYNGWRNRLAVMAGYSSFEEACTTPEGPFVELINFSDCEGVICAEVSEKLYNDFLNNHVFAKEKMEQYDLETYEDFMNGFASAKENGCLVFS